MLTDDELFPVKEIHRLFTHGVRTFVSGYSVLEREVTLWYADRMGIVKSKPFDFYKEPHLLLLFAAALCNPHPHGLGILPFVHCDETGCRLLDEFRFPRLGHFTVNQPFLSFQIDCSLGRLVYTANDGVDARGTSVWPILSADQKSADLCGTGRLVAKIAWPRRNAPREDLILKRIRRKLEAHPLADAKKILDHIVDLKFSLNLTMDHGSLDIPRAKMGDFYGVIFQERVCSILVMEEYFHLRSVADSFEFEKVYIDAIVGKSIFLIFFTYSLFTDMQCVAAYDWVFNVANVLHRDISMDNIMFRRNPDNSVQGVLCDWDNALIRPILGHMAYTSDPPPCIPLYMSIDRLLALSWHADRETLHPDHRIEHDLESFFYLLVYFIATQNQKHCTWVAFGWLAQEPWDYVAQSKRRFLLYDDEFNRFFPPNLGEYQRYLDPNGLVHKLRAIWMKAYTWKAGSGMRSGRPIRPARIFKALGVDGFKQPNV